MSIHVVPIEERNRFKSEQTKTLYMLFLKEYIARIINLFSRVPKGHASILMYHSIGYNEKFSTVAPENFEKQLTYLQRKDYTVVRLSDLIHTVSKEKPSSLEVSLTFDDGYEDFYTNAFPILKKYRVPATLFVPTAFIGATIAVSGGRDIFQQMTTEQIKEVSSSGLIDVMPHTVHHVKLHKLGFEEACTEIESSREVIEEITGKKADIFAFPSGKYTEELTDYLRNNSNWLGAVTVEQGVVSDLADPFKLPRNSIDSQVGIQQFQMKLSGSILKYIAIKKCLKL